MSIREWVYKQTGRIDYVITYILFKLKIKKRMFDLVSSRKSSFIQLSLAIDDAMKFYGLTKKEYFQKAKNWKLTEKKLFDNASSLKEFYASWNDEASIENTCANIMNQMILFENYSVCAEYALKSDVVIDYGCGTGSLSLGLALDGKIKGKLVLLDVQNDIDDFRKFRVDENNLSNVSTADIFNFNKRNIADLVICLDVLEHIEESSDVFINSLSPLLKAGGYLILKAPWRGQMTHIDKAADDFYLNGARRFLLENYKLIYRFGAIDVCAVYQKIK